MAACADTSAPGQAPERPVDETQSTTVSQKLSNEDIDSLETRASGGSGEDAYRLFMYYMTTKRDMVESHYWLEVSAENGFPTAMHALGLYLSIEALPDKPTHNSKIRGKYWLQRAKDSGYADPAEQLKQIDKK